jgi:hypothetical protein
MFLENQSRLDSNMSESHGSASIVGVVLHRKSGCAKKTSSHIQGEGTEYGPWLRVSPLGRHSRAVKERDWERADSE